MRNIIIIIFVFLLHPLPLQADWLREQGVHSIEIQVLAHNDPSWKLYESMGFQLELRQARLLWDDYDKYKDARS